MPLSATGTGAVIDAIGHRCTDLIWRHCTAGLAKREQPMADPSANLQRRFCASVPSAMIASAARYTVERKGTGAHAHAKLLCDYN